MYVNEPGPPPFSGGLPKIVLLCFCALEQLWTAEDVNEALNAFRDGRSIRHAGHGDTTNSRGGKTVFTPGEGTDVVTNCSGLFIKPHGDDLVEVPSQSWYRGAEEYHDNLS